MSKFITLNADMTLAQVTEAASIKAVKAGADQFVFDVAAVDFAAFQTSALLALFNSITGQSVTRFATRAAGIKRLEAALLDLAEAPVAEEEVAEAPAKAKFVWSCGYCPKCEINEDQTPAGMEDTVGGQTRNMCHLCGTEYNQETGKVWKAPAASAERAAAIANSWLDPEVAAKRAARHAVRVGGQEYNSVREAFVKLGLPISQHIKFRMQLKAAGTLTAYSRVWFVIER